MRTAILIALGVGVWALASGHVAAWDGNPGYKLGRGLTNATLGFLSYPAHADACSQRHPDHLYSISCVAMAVVPTIGQHVLGMLEVLTFPVPFPWPNYASPYDSPGDLPWERAGRYRPNRNNPPIP